MPTTYEVVFRLRTVLRQITFADVHRLACYLVEEPGPEAHAAQVKSFSVWPLHYDNDRWYLTINAVNDSEQWDRRINDRLAKTPHLGPDIPLVGPRLHVARVSFSEIAKQSPRTRQRVTFVSPTTFSRNGRSYALPDPVLIHRQLARKWNLFAPPELKWSDETVEQLCQTVVLESANIEASRLPNLGSRVGFVGSAEFRTEHTSAAIFSSLWHFATFCGVGSLTTQGLGAVQLPIDERSARTK